MRYKKRIIKVIRKNARGYKYMHIPVEWIYKYGDIQFFIAYEYPKEIRLVPVTEKDIEKVKEVSESE